MKKQTHKLRALQGDVQAVMATSSSLTEAARRLDVNRSTLHRWIEAGKVPAPTGKSPRPPDEAPPQSPTDALPAEGWAQSVRNLYALTATEGQLVDMADSARRIAHNATEPAAVRLAAMARFAALVKQLDLEPEAAGGSAETKPDNVQGRRESVRRAASADPRRGLMAVK